MSQNTHVDTFIHRSIVPGSAREVFAWHEEPEALLALAPARLGIAIESRTGGLRDGGRVTFVFGVGPIRLRWRARHFGFIEGRQFCDEQVTGPFTMWRHTHRVVPINWSSCLYEDVIEFAVPGGTLVERALHPLVRLMLSTMFAHRHRVVRDLFADRRDARMRKAS